MRAWLETEAREMQPGHCEKERQTQCGHRNNRCNSGLSVASRDTTWKPQALLSLYGKIYQ